MNFSMHTRKNQEIVSTFGFESVQDPISLFIVSTFHKTLGPEYS